MSTHNLDSVDGLDLDRSFAYKDCGIPEGFDGVSTADEISFIGTNCVINGMRSLRLSESTNSTVQPADVKGGSFYVHETQQSGQTGQAVEADCETENEQDEGRAAHRIPSYYHLEEMNKTPVVRMVRLAAVPSQYQLDCLSEVFFLDASVLSPFSARSAIHEKDPSSTETAIDTNVPLPSLAQQHQQPCNYAVNVPEYYADASVRGADSEYVTPMTFY